MALPFQNVYIQPSRVPKDVLTDERRKFWVEEGDHMSLLNIYNAFTTRGKLSGKWCHEHYFNFKALSRAVSIRGQLKKYLARFNIPLESCLQRHGKTATGRAEATRQIRRCITSGYFSQAAKADVDGSGRFRTIRDNVVLNVHPSSVLFSRNAKYVVFHEVVETNQAYMRDVTVIEPEWLSELAPHFYEYKK
jgi:ATP-dependent RNA helicase DDX35